MLLAIGQTSNMMGISISTLRRWHRSGHFVPDFFTVGGHRRYSIIKIKEFLGDFVATSKRKVIAYARVSSHDQKEDLKRQIIRLQNYCESTFKNFELINDLGSGMNYKKRP